jgi:dsDNA-specific endonuclease/ATPase MutS2
VSEDEKEAEDVIEVPIDGMLDLHTFRPQEMSDVVREYLEVAAERGLSEVRIVHGKGKGVLRNGVLALLDKLPQVVSYRSAGAGRGDWGATIVTLGTSRDGGNENTDDDRDD